MLTREQALNQAYVFTCLLKFIKNLIWHKVKSQFDLKKNVKNSNSEILWKMKHVAHIPTMGYTCTKFEKSNDSSNLKDVTEWKGFCRETDKWTSLKQTSIPTPLLLCWTWGMISCWRNSQVVSPHASMPMWCHFYGLCKISLVKNYSPQKTYNHQKWPMKLCNILWHDVG